MIPTRGRRPARTSHQAAAPKNPRRPQTRISRLRSALAAGPALLRAACGQDTESDGPRANKSASVGLIGLDMSQSPKRLRARSTVPILITALASALFLVALRSEVLRLRHALANAVAEEQELSERKRRLTVEMRKLRDPGHLTHLARDLGFGHPERLLHLYEDSAPPDAPDTRLAAADLWELRP